jgi:hypothetical protein
MRYRLLGSVEVISTDRQVVALSGERERTLLATLALRAEPPSCRHSRSPSCGRTPS